MATIKNIIQTVFQSSGANNTNQDIDRVNRNMTRLGQSSAGAGRSFAAQSQGLGGLVAAYAGAAATTFALQQAFDSLAKSARQTQTLEGLSTLAAASGETSTILLDNVREITKNQLTLAESASQINLSLSAGFDSSQIEGLSAVALKASRALGRDLNDAYTRVVRGSAKMETELLDELGIYTKIEPATRAYAAAIGKSASELTEFERRQAFVNSVIEEGNRKFSVINTTIPTTAEKIEAFGTRILDIAGALGRFLADTVAPLAEFLTNNLAASFGSVGLAAGLVASKGIQVLKEGIDNFANSVEARATRANQAILSIGSAARQAQEDARKSLLSVSGGSGLRGESREEIKSLKDLANQRKLTTDELKRGIRALKDRASVLESDLIPKNKELIATLESSQKNLRQGSAEFEKNARSIETTNKALTRNIQLLESTKTQLNAVTVAASSTQAGFAAFAGSAISLGGKVSASLASTVTGFVSLGATLISTVSILGIIGTSIATLTGKQDEYNATIENTIKLLKSFFVPSDVVDTTNTYLSLTADALKNLESSNQQLKEISSFKFESNFVLGFTVDIEKTKEDLVKEVSSALVEAGKEGGKRFVDSLLSASAGVGAIIGGTIGTAIGAAIGMRFGGTFAASIGKIIGVAIGGAIGAAIDQNLSNNIKNITDQRVRELEQIAGLELGSLQDNKQLREAAAILDSKYGAAAALSLEGRKYLATQLQTANELAKSTSNIRELTRLSKELSISADQVVKKFKTISSDKYSLTVTPNLDFIENLDTNIELTIINEDELFNVINEIKNQINSISVDDTSLRIASADFRDLEASVNFAAQELRSLENSARAGEAALRSNSLNVAQNIKNTSEEISYYTELVAKYKKELSAEEFSTAASYSSADIMEQLTIRVSESAAVQDLINTIKDLENAKKQLQNIEAQEAYTTANLSARVEELNTRIDLQREKVKSLSVELSESRKKALAFGDSVSLISNGILDLASYNQTTTTSLSRLSNSLIDLNTAASNGGLSLELLGQKEGVLLKQFEAISTATVFSRDKIQELTNSLEGLNALNAESVADTYNLEVSGVENIRAELEARLQAQSALNEKNSENVDIAFKVYEAFLLQLEPLREQLRLQQQLKDTFGKDVFTPKREFGLAEGQFAFKDDQERQIAQANKLSNILSDNLVIINREAELRKGILEIEGLTQAQQQALLTTTRETAAETVKGLDLKEDQLRAVNALLGGQEAINVATALEKGNIESATLAANVLLNVMGERLNKSFAILDNWKKQISSIEQETRQFLAEDRIAKIKLQLDATNLDFSIAAQEIQNQISNIQGNIKITQAEESAGLISAVEAAQTIAASNESLIQLQFDLADTRYAQELASLTAREDILAEETTLTINELTAKEELLKAQINADKQYIQATIDAMNESSKQQDSINSQFISGLAQTLTNFLAGLAQVIPDSGDASVVVASYTSAVTEISNTFEAESASIIGSIESSFQTRREAVAENSAIALENLNKERQLAGLKHEETLNQLGSEAAARAINDQAAIADAKKGKGASDDAKKALKEAEKAQKEFFDQVEKGFEALKKLATDFVKLAFDGLINSKQLEVEASKASEGLATEILTFTTSELNSVQTDLNESLSKETSLKEELLSLTERLNASQVTYLRAIAEGDLASASEEYVDNILEQSRKTVELNQAIRDRSILEGAAQTLEQQKVSAQQAVEQATRERMDREQELAELQEISAGVLSLLSTEVSSFTDSLKELGPVLSVLSGQVSGEIPGVSDPIGALTKSFTDSINTLLKAQEVLGAGTPITDTAKDIADSATQQATSKTVADAAQTAGETVANSFASKAVAGISSALSGASIGNSIAQIMGDDTYASTIGGAIGGVVSSVWGGAIASSIAGGLGVAAGTVAASLLTSAVTFGLPIIGALLFGGLFGGPKKPGAEVRGEATGEGFEVSSIRRKDGLSRQAGEQLGDFVDQVYGSLFTGLERAGLSFMDEFDVFVRNTEGEFGRITTTFKDGTKLTAADLGSSAEDAANELVRQFLGGLKVTRNDDNVVTFRSLVVDALTPNAADLQQAIDTFAELDDVTAKTQERFNAGIEFATKFGQAISELSNAAPTLASSLELIAQSADANARNIIAQYNSLQQQTDEFFGASSEQADRAAKAIKVSALAQLGLAESADGSLISVDALTEGLTAGRLSVSKLVNDIEAFDVVLTELGYSAEETARIIAQSTDISLGKLIEDFNSALQTELDILLNPNQAGVNQFLEVQKAGNDLFAEATGIYEGVIEEQSRVQREAAETTASSLEDLNSTMQEAISTFPQLEQVFKDIPGAIDSGLVTGLESLKELQLQIAPAQEKLSSAKTALTAFSGNEDEASDRMEKRSLESAFREAQSDLNSIQTSFDSAIASFVSLNPAFSELANLDPTAILNYVDSISSTQTAAAAAATAQAIFAGQTESNAAKQAEAAEGQTVAEQLARERSKASLKDLNTAQIELLLSTDAITDSEVKLYAQQQLRIKQQIDATENLKRFTSAFKSFNQRISDITGRVADPRFSAIFASLSDVVNILGDTDVSDFALSLTDAVNKINAATDISANFSSGLSLIKSSLEEGTITNTQYVDSFSLLVDAALTAVEEQKALVDEYERLAKQLKDVFNSSLSDVQDSISGFRDELVGLVGAISESSNSILGIYDDTLTDLASSGNELFDIRDAARSAFEASAQAVREFEKANSLSGKSASAIRTELEAVESSINSVLSGGSLDFAAFRELSELTSRQTSLTRELNSVSSAESEYSALISDREQAANDLAFAESAIITLGENLIDTRRSESETIQQVQDTTLRFVQAQEDLKDITQLLAESNFDLNQVRQNETDRVKEVSKALNNLDKDLSSLEGLLSSLLSSSELRNKTIDAARNLGIAIAKNLEFDQDSVEWNEVINTKIKEATDAFDKGLIPLANTLNTLYGLNVTNMTGISEELEILSENSNSLTSSFSQFNTDLVKYLDTEGLATFYGPGGVFSTFRDSLISTLTVEGFDILTAKDGPLEGFGLTLINTKDALVTLAEKGVTSIESVQGVSTAFGSLVQVIGSDSEGLTTAVNSLILVGEVSASTIATLGGSLDGFKLVLTELNSLDITFDAKEDLDNIVNSVILFDTGLSQIDVTTNLTSLSQNIAGQVTVFGQDIADIPTVTMSFNFNTLSNNISTQVGDFTQAIADISTVTMSFTFVTLATSITNQVGDFTQSIADISTVSMSFNFDTLSGTISTQVSDFTQAIADISTVTMSFNFNSLSGSISTQVGDFTQAIADVSTVTTRVNFNSLSDSISIQVGDFTQDIADISTVTMSFNFDTLSESISTEIGNFIQDIADIPTTNIDTNFNTLSENIGSKTALLGADIAAYNTTLSEVDISSLAAYATSASTDFSNFNTTLDLIDLKSIEDLETYIDDTIDSFLSVFTIEDTTNIDKLSKALTDLNTVAEAIVNTDINPLEDAQGSVQDLILDFNTLNTAINNLTAGGGIATLTQQIASVLTQIQNAIGSVDLSTPTPTIDFSNRIDAAYQSVLQRAPDSDGRAFYQGVLQQDPTFDLVTELSNSIEKTVIIPAFQSVLNRLPAFSEVETYLSRINATPGYDVAENLRRSTGYENSASNSNDTTSSPEEDIVKERYSAFLNRAPEPEALSFYSDLLRTDPNFNLGTELAASAEYQVRQAYLQIAKREPDSAGLAFWMNQVNNNPDISIFDVRAALREAEGFSAGGYVTGPGTSTSDSIPAALSNGEFVMRASAVDKIGLGVLTMLNATGNIMSAYSADSNFTLRRAPTGVQNTFQNTQNESEYSTSDTNVEVNVINNGTSQQPATEPTVRRENGKIIVDVILEDIRNNGPIKRTIRSIR